MKDISVYSGKTDQSYACNTCKFSGRCDESPTPKCRAHDGQHYPKNNYILIEIY